MYFKLRAEQESYLLNQPETGMGYQIIEAHRPGKYKSEEFLVLNSEIVIEMDGSENGYIRKIISEGLRSAKAGASYIALNIIRVLNDKQFRNVVNESKSRESAIDNPIENANGEETFVRLSAFDDDKRMDKVNKCLRPGSYTTTMDDYLKCKSNNDDPVERYALLSDDKIQFAFYIQPKKSNTLQRGIVQPVNGKRGGGKEAYFHKGTSNDTFLKQTPY